MLVLLATGCATARPLIAWPGPPATERVRFVKSLSGPADFESGVARFFRKLSGAEAPVQLFHPVGVAVTPGGDLVVVTDQALAQLFLFDVEKGAVKTIAKEVLGGVPVGVALEGDKPWVVVPQLKAALQFSREGAPLRRVELGDCERPVGVSVDVGNDVLYVTDTSSPTAGSHAVHTYRLSTGEPLATLGKKGEGPGELFFPTFVSVLPSGNVLVADTMNARVQELTADGAFVRQFGERGDQFGQFDKPKGVATDSFGNVYVVDSFFSVVQIFNRDGKLLLFFGGRGDSSGFLSNPAGIAIDAKNRIYVTNGLNFRVEVYELVNTTAADSATTPGA
jgi:DNA-binding beta-propeller fold protein YncE